MVNGGLTKGVAGIFTHFTPGAVSDVMGIS